MSDDSNVFAELRDFLVAYSATLEGAIISTGAAAVVFAPEKLEDSAVDRLLANIATLAAYFVAAGKVPEVKPEVLGDNPPERFGELMSKAAATGDTARYIIEVVMPLLAFELKRPDVPDDLVLAWAEEVKRKARELNK